MYGRQAARSERDRTKEQRRQRAKRRKNGMKESILLAIKGKESDEMMGIA
jgi:hypothetical protein